MNIKKLALGAAAGAVILALVAAPVFAKPADGNGMNDGQAGQSNMVRKNLEYAEETPGYENAWGRVVYNHEGETLNFVLNAHNLLPNTDYVVKSQGNTLGEGTSNPAGELHINGSWSCNGTNLSNGRINVREKVGNARVLWTELYDVFVCES